MKKLLILLCLVLGCVHVGTGYQYTHKHNFPRNPIILPVHLDVNFSINDINNIQKALNEWNYSLNRYAAFKVIDYQFDMQMDRLNQTDYYIFKVGNGNPLVMEADLKGREYGDPNLALGFTLGTGSHYIYLIRDRLEDQDVFFITMHEIGHSLGATHSGEGLMYPHYTRDNFKCVDKITALKVAAYQGMDFSYLNYCY